MDKIYNLKISDIINICKNNKIIYKNLKIYELINLLKNFNTKKSLMLKSMYKKNNVIGSGIGIKAEKLNKNPNECRWYTLNIGDGKIKNCNFNYVIKDYKNFKITTIPTNTELYHTSKTPRSLPLEPKDWSNKKLVWFTPSKAHLNIHLPEIIIKTKTKSKINLLFIQNLKLDLNINSGFNIFPKLIILCKKIKELYNIEIDGYIGCNECEIGLFNTSLNKLFYPPKIISYKDL